MDAYLLTWLADIKKTNKSAPVPPVDIAAPLTPLLDRLKKLIETLPPAQQGLPLEFFRERLLGRQAGRNVHSGELGAALRKFGYTRRRTWSKSDGGFRALWWPPK